MKYLQNALNILRVEPDEILYKYFSSANVNYLQQQIVSGVKSNTQITISRQSDDELVNMMLFMFESYKTVVRGLPVRKAVSDLNTHVLNKTIQMVSHNASSQMKYIEYISKPIDPIPLAISTTSRGKDVFNFRPGM